LSREGRLAAPMRNGGNPCEIEEAQVGL